MKAVSYTVNRSNYKKHSMCVQWSSVSCMKEVLVTVATPVKRNYLHFHIYILTLSCSAEELVFS